MAKPDAGRIALGHFLPTWIDHRANLRPRTVQLYRWLYRRYLEQTFSGVMIADLTPARVRAWRAGLVMEGTSATMIAKAYRLLHAVLNTALDDIIRRNPCRIRGAGEAHTAERPIATVAQVIDLAGRVPSRFRALILLAGFTGLRYGELVALRRADLGSALDTVTVRASKPSHAGPRRQRKPGSLASTSTIFATRATPSRPARAQASPTSGPGWAMAPPAPRSYIHATEQRDATIADALSVSIDLERDRARNGDDPDG